MRSSILKDVEAGLDELKLKTLKTIQCETAIKWAGRAIAAKFLGKPESEVTEYAHEAIEHAALCGVDNVLSQVRAAFDEVGIEA